MSRYDDGIPETRLWRILRHQRRRVQALAAMASAKRHPPSAPPPEPVRPAPVAAGRRGVGHPSPYARVHILDDKGQVLRDCRTTQEAAAALGTTRAYVTSSLYRGITCRGRRLRWVEPEVIGIRGGKQVRYASVMVLARAINADLKMVYRALRIGSRCRGMEIVWASEFDAKEAIAS